MRRRVRPLRGARYAAGANGYGLRWHTEFRRGCATIRCGCAPSFRLPGGDIGPKGKSGRTRAKMGERAELGYGMRCRAKERTGRALWDRIVQDGRFDWVGQGFRVVPR